MMFHNLFENQPVADDQFESTNDDMDNNDAQEEQEAWDDWSENHDPELENTQFVSPEDESINFTEVDVLNAPLLEPESSEIDFVDINDTEHWHEQAHDDTCGIVAQEYILDDIGQAYGIDFSEDELRDTAMACGWYIPDGGTPMIQVGNLLEAYGIRVERSFNNSLEDIDHQIQAGNKVLVAVDSDEIWNPDGIDSDDLIANLLGMPGQEPNHTVQVIGVDNSDPDNPMVILNDPGTPDGQGLRVQADDFLNAWEDSNNFMVATTDRNLNPNPTQLASDNNSEMNSILLGSVEEGDDQAYWGNSYQGAADDAKGWADIYGSAGNIDKALEFEKKAAEAQEKANEHFDKAKEEYQDI